MPGWELIGEEERAAANDVFDKGGVLYRYGLDARRQKIFRVDELERQIARRVNVKYCQCVCNGTAALKACLIALGVKPGDEVITPSFTFIATVEAIQDCGAIPVIAEIDRSLNMDPVDLEKKITNKTRVIIPVHMAGVAAKMDEIMAIAKKHNIAVLEDSAQAMGATYKGKECGTIADMGIYSLDIGKVITTGEGGVIVTDNERLWRTAREYSDHGHECNPNLPRGRDTRTISGFNYKMMELQGAVGLAQLKKMDYVLKKQRENKGRVKEGLRHIRNISWRELPDEEGDAGDTLIFFVESKEKAKVFAEELGLHGIGTKNLPDAIDWHYAGTWSHIFNSYPQYNGKDLEQLWRQSTDLIRSAISIPILVNMDDAQIGKIVNAITEIAGKLQ